MFDTPLRRDYQNHVQGIWGEFESSSGTVAYIQAKARLGAPASDPERRLTQQLRPVREVLPTETLDFNQLLQRDLDDYRVAEDLIPYLLKPNPVGPTFFPPIMAVLLPFRDNKPAGAFPVAIGSEVVRDATMDIYWSEQQCGDAFSVRRLANSRGDINPLRLGQLRWNDEHAKLVVLDGQHRAMALIAIDRTLNTSWSSGPGQRYKHFYERPIQEALRELEQRKVAIELEKIEVPVTVCWFPKLSGEGHDPHKAARKLFVDVNKEARKPSEARLTLLSDAELLNVLTRSLLSRLRHGTPVLPLYAVEYDNPDRDTARPVRWSVLTNLNLLKFATRYCIFGPSKYLKSMMTNIGGRLPLGEMDAFMRNQLDVSTLYANSVVDGDRVIERESIGNMHFPVRSVEALVARFGESWGQAILTVIGKLAPYAAHCDALRKLKESWAAGDSFSALAEDALFGGMGMYWTLRSSANGFEDARVAAQRQRVQEPARPDVLKAWEVLESKKNEFVKQRAFAYLGRSGDADVGRSEGLYEVVNTHACQLGAVLSMASLAVASDLPWEKVAAFAENLVAAWNAALTSPRTNAESRRLVLGRENTIAHPLNQLGRMDTTFALYFRYFWFELLLLPVAREVLANDSLVSRVESLCASARSAYADHLVGERIAGIRKSLGHSRREDDERVANEAKAAVAKDMARALQHWFEYSATRANEVAQVAVYQPLFSADIEPADTEPTGADAPPPADVTDSTPAGSLKEILADLKSD